MEFRCPHCDQTTPFVSAPPKFCPECGVANQNGMNKQVREEATIAPSKTGVKFSSIENATIANSKIANYRLVKPLGSGGMGVVWEAIEDKTDRRVALKTLRPHSLNDTETIQRFIREAKLAAKISHPNVTFIYGAGEYEGKHFIAMELMPGDTLADKVSDTGPMQVGKAVDAILDVVDGLISAHRLGLIHRDIKPSNCFVAEDGSVKIGDFGLSKSTVKTDLALTQDAKFLGTPSYSAPEQIRGGTLDARTDIYSIGATLYQLLTGRTPFVGESISVTAQIIADPAPPARSWNSLIPLGLDKIIRTCLEKSPDNRYQTLTKLRSALTPFGTQGTSISDFGRRMTAYMIDFIGITLVNLVITFIIIVPRTFAVAGDEQATTEVIEGLQPYVGLLTSVSILLYFFLAEWLFGKTVGKHLMNLQVVDPSGNKPGFFRTLTRVIVFPVFFGLPLIYQFFFHRQLALDSGSQVIQILTGVALTAVPMLICCSPMKRRNGGRGLHGLISGTHVERIHVKELQNFSLPTSKPLTKEIKPITFGPYVADRFLCDTNAGKVYLGHDKNLDRDVWILESPDKTPPSTARIELARPGRQRWLDGNVKDESRWDAYEPIEGFSVLALVGSKRHGSWKNYRVLLEQVALELCAAIEDQTVPDTLYLSQVVVNDEGNVKILDRHPLDAVTSTSSKDHFDPLANAIQSQCDGHSHDNDAVCLFKDLAALVARRQSELPFCAQNFFDELSEKPLEPSTLDWALERLAELSEGLQELKWDSRLGVLGITIAIEGVLYFTLSSMIFIWIVHFSSVPVTLKYVVGLAASLAVPLAFGAWFRGGLVFKLMGIGVANKKGKPAGPVRCGIRSAVAWFCQSAAVGGFVIANVIAYADVKALEPGSLADQLYANQNVMITTFLLFMLSQLFVIVGAAAAVLLPTRGLQDFAAGTRLTPK